MTENENERRTENIEKVFYTTGDRIFGVKTTRLQNGSEKIGTSTSDSSEGTQEGERPTKPSIKEKISPSEAKQIEEQNTTKKTRSILWVFLKGFLVVFLISLEIGLIYILCLLVNDLYVLLYSTPFI
ncbi:uncharacterized protein VNE69_07287 [Vairimorpha necatrix]|uniref:Membrane protein n=1 Tax=Vairimorpha necatrix TaxID=6039 RepID=A0AAX4JE29_9MICR